MLDFLLDILEPFAELVLCRFDIDVWTRHRLRVLGQTILLLICAIPVVAGIYSGSWIAVVIGLLGTGFVIWKGSRYSIWWIREGRFGAEPVSEDSHTLLDDIPLPKGDIMEQLPEDEQLRDKLEDSHRCLNSRM